MNPQIATGHVMRCLSIADEAKQKGIDTLFLGADENGRALVESRGHKYRSLGSEWNRLEEETGRILSAICEKSVSHIFVDSYYISSNYLREVRKHVYTIYIDDYGSETFPVDMLLCYAVYAEKLGLNEKYASAKTKILSGPKYSPLRGMFFHLPKREISERIRKVLILSGGGDIYGAQERVLECITNL